LALALPSTQDYSLAFVPLSELKNKEIQSRIFLDSLFKLDCICILIITINGVLSNPSKSSSALSNVGNFVDLGPWLAQSLLSYALLVHLLNCFLYALD
jgi:hypothetical protein